MGNHGIIIIMNLLLSNVLAKSIQDGQSVFGFIGGTNASQLNAGATSKVMTITNNIGNPLHILGFVIRFNTGFDDCLINIVDTQRNKNIITGSTQLCQVGVSKSLNDSFSLFPICPFTIISGNSVDVTVNNVTVSNLPINGLSVGLYGIQLN